MTRHLTTHLNKETKAKSSKQKAFHIKIMASEMFLHLLVDGAATLQTIDSFLRAIWLECCGHMSAFKVKNKIYDYDWDTSEFGESMSQRLDQVFVKGVQLEYDYDFGSTTRLELEVLGEYNIDVPNELLLLSRNEPLPILCHDCNEKPAQVICSVCLYSGPAFFCKRCAKKHAKSCEDFADYASMDVCNSPRMGVCGYDGGTIDTKRDGVWKG